MSGQSRFPAVVVYLIPFVGWAYVFFFQRQNALAIYHLKQAIGLFVFLIAVLAGWGVIAWILAWIPYMGAVGMALFTLVIAAYLFGVIAWLVGTINALANRMERLPVMGRWAERLPIQ